MSIFGSITLWLAIGVLYVLWVERKVIQLYGSRDEQERQVHGFAQDRMTRLQVFALVACTWPYWLAKDVPHEARMLRLRIKRLMGG